MMYLILILFFLSLLSIIFMIGRKLVLLKNVQSYLEEGVSFEVPYLKEIRTLTVKNIKKYEHLSLVLMLRAYVQSTNLLKDKYKEARTKLKNKLNKKSQLEDSAPEKQEVSKFLKMISDYKRKIKEIKHKIHEEENSP